MNPTQKKLHDAIVAKARSSTVINTPTKGTKITYHIEQSDLQTAIEENWPVLTDEMIRATKQLHEEAGILKDHCIEQKYIDWEDESIDGCKAFDKAMDEVARTFFDGQ